MPVRRLSFWSKPAEILLFGVFCIIFGLLVAIAGVVIGVQLSQTSPNSLSGLVVLAGLGMVVSGAGFMAGKSWGYAGSILVFSIAYLTSIIQAFQREYVWGIFLNPIVLSFLILPRIRTYFFKQQAQQAVTSSEISNSIETILSKQSQISQSSDSTKPTIFQRFRKPSHILTIILILGIIAPVPVVASSVHTVTVTQVTLNILYPSGSRESNITTIWFGSTPQTISGGGITWGTGKLPVAFSLTNLGLFEEHTVDWIHAVTSGFTLYTVGLPINVPDLETVDIHLILQAPDYNYYGPVVLELHTT